MTEFPETSLIPTVTPSCSAVHSGLPRHRRSEPEQELVHDGAKCLVSRCADYPSEPLSRDSPNGLTHGPTGSLEPPVVGHRNVMGKSTLAAGKPGLRVGRELSAPLIVW